MHTLRLELTTTEHDALLRLLRDAANEPADIDFIIFVTLLAKVECAS